MRHILQKLTLAWNELFLTVALEEWETATCRSTMTYHLRNWSACNWSVAEGEDSVTAQWEWMSLLETSRTFLVYLAGGGTWPMVQLLCWKVPLIVKSIKRKQNWQAKCERKRPSVQKPTFWIFSSPYSLWLSTRLTPDIISAARTFVSKRVSRRNCSFLALLQLYK